MEWNEAAEAEQVAEQSAPKVADNHSVFSYSKYFFSFISNFFYVESGMSKKSNVSKMSYKSRLADEKTKQSETKSQWNESVTSSKRELTTEDKLARKIAQEVLRDNAKLRGVHSGASMKKIIEKEAKR